MAAFIQGNFEIQRSIKVDKFRSLFHEEKRKRRCHRFDQLNSKRRGRSNWTFEGIVSSRQHLSDVGRQERCHVEVAQSRQVCRFGREIPAVALRVLLGEAISSIQTNG